MMKNKVPLPMKRMIQLLSKPTTTVYFAREIAEMLLEYERHEIGTAYLHGYQDGIKWVQEGTELNSELDVKKFINENYEND